MPSRPPYPEAYRAELVRLVREEGRTPNELAKEFEPTAQSITNCAGKQTRIRHTSAGRHECPVLIE